MGTLDAHLVAIDAKTRPAAVEHARWPRARRGYSVTHAPLVVKDKVIVGVGGGEYGIRGFVAAFDARSGREAWRFYTIPGAGRAGRRFVEAVSAEDRRRFCDPEAWKHGGGSVWVTGSYDPALNLTYWGVGNAGPDWNNEQRPGDNLYTDSVVALDADTGRLKWHYQFTPHDRYDYDSVQVPVLADITWRGAPLKAMVWANRNGNFYVLDRETGKFLVGKPFVKVNWMDTFDERGRPHPDAAAGRAADVAGQSGRHELVLAVVQPAHRAVLRVRRGKATRRSSAARRSSIRKGGTSAAASTGRSCRCPARRRCPGIRRGPINNWTEAAATGAVLALDAATGELKWKFPMTDVTDSGILTTASDVLFTGGREGYFQALDARTGALLWKASLGAQIVSGPITYEVDGKQYVTAISGLSLCVFGLRE